MVESIRPLCPPLRPACRITRPLCTANRLTNRLFQLPVAGAGREAEAEDGGVQADHLPPLGDHHNLGRHRPQGHQRALRGGQLVGPRPHGPAREPRRGQAQPRLRYLRSRSHMPFSIILKSQSSSNQFNDQSHMPFNLCLF